MTGAAIAAVTELPPGRYPDHDAVGMYREVLLQFLREWTLAPSDINGLMAAPAGVAIGEDVEMFTHEILYDELGLQPAFSEVLSAGGASFTLMVQRAVLAIDRGLTDSVLCIGAGKFPKVGAGAAESMAKLVSHPQYEFIYGAPIYAIYAQVASAHMAAYGTTKEDMARVAVSARRWALLHPHATMRTKGEISVADVLNSRPIASPFNMLDCSVPCEGGAAVLVTSTDLAHKLSDRPAHIVGMGEHHTHGFISQAPSLTTLGAVTSGRQAFEMAGAVPSDIDALQLYDAFTVNPLITLEDLGFCKKGKAGAVVHEGRTDPGGNLPINTYGGLLSYGHTGDASGMSMLVEGALQVMGRAGDRQLDRADLVLVHTYGGMMAEHSTLILGGS